ncbi:hypothetical protein Anapl_01570 [Anas platyrhynchos]|uniref:Uncharacterized protein n=1 Tax=Anas platyrhynchos TaxID=8839 RepID=R0JX29_ANAPL|nr:hypothetical protein Anapl_01570 [Anas platyrhynchos]
MTVSKVFKLELTPKDDSKTNKHLPRSRSQRRALPAPGASPLQRTKAREDTAEYLSQAQNKSWSQTPQATENALWEIRHLPVTSSSGNCHHTFTLQGCMHDSSIFLGKTTVQNLRNTVLWIGFQRQCKDPITPTPRAKQSLAEGSTLAPILSYEPSTTEVGSPPKARERTKLADGSRPLPRSPDTWKLMDMWNKPKQHFHCPKCISGTSPKWIREAQKPIRLYDARERKHGCFGRCSGAVQRGDCTALQLTSICLLSPAAATPSTSSALTANTVLLENPHEHKNSAASHSTTVTRLKEDVRGSQCPVATAAGLFHSVALVTSSTLQASFRFDPSANAQLQEVTEIHTDYLLHPRRTRTDSHASQTHFCHSCSVCWTGADDTQGPRHDTSQAACKTVLAEQQQRKRVTRVYNADLNLLLPILSAASHLHFPSASHGLASQSSSALG